jgi:predicted nucleotidyltransferase
MKTRKKKSRTLTCHAILEELSARKTELATLYSARKIGVFGSFARGQATALSDIDLLVELDEPTFDNFMDLKFALEKLWGRKVDLVTLDALKPRLKSAIQNELIYAEG